MPNKLISESSPYLLQHAHNPVHWQPFGEEALLEAQRRNCPILISIGYSACHWCHVMEHESFRDQDIAEIMNRLFVCIKVDREERPDIDQNYLNAVQLLHGQGGWPLNCFALPDGRPFWGGTYFRPDHWKELLVQLSDLYHNNYEEILEQAIRLHQGLKSMGIINKPEDSTTFHKKTLEDIFNNLAFKFDKANGGLKGAPKFPMPVVWQFVLNYYYLSRSEDAFTQLKLTLDKMAMGGIFDQIGGGFARYSTDAHWKVPHFEKMIYDNAQLASIYAEAFKMSGNQNYLDVLTKILQFVDAELTAPEGAFYSALDADSEGQEGKFYVWNKQELIDLLPEYADLLSRYWGIERQGLWENGYNILLRPFYDEQFAKAEHLSQEELKQLVNMASRVMLNYRNTKIKPHLDDKIVLSWNSLMIKAYSQAAIATGNINWTATAIKAANFIWENMIKDGRIYRTYKNGTSRINGFLDDYTFAAEAFIYLYQLTFDEKWILRSRKLVEYVLEHFGQETSPLFWYLPKNNEDVYMTHLSRILETNDGVEPSGNSVMAWNLLALGNYFENNQYIDRSAEMCNYILSNTEKYPSYNANWANVIAAHVHGISMFVVAGEDAYHKAIELNTTFMPLSLVAAAPFESQLPVFNHKFKQGRTLIYKCTDHECDAPVEKIEDLIL